MTFWQWADRNPFELLACVFLITMSAVGIAASCSGSETEHRAIGVQIGPEPIRRSE